MRFSESPTVTMLGIRSSDDALTLAASGILAYVSCDLLHEMAGHGGVCLTTGGRAITFSTVHFQCNGGWQPLNCAAGILLNITGGTLLWLALRRMRGSLEQGAVIYSHSSLRLRTSRFKLCGSLSFLLLHMDRYSVAEHLHEPKDRIECGLPPAVALFQSSNHGLADTGFLG